MHGKLSAMVSTLDREAWLEEETSNFQQKVIDAETRENWRRVSGSSGLNPRQLETVRQIVDLARRPSQRNRSIAAARIAGRLDRRIGETRIDRRAKDQKHSRHGTSRIQ